MYKYVSSLLFSASVFLVQTLPSQSISYQTGTTAEEKLIKQSETMIFSAGSENYFITTYYKDAYMHYNLIRYNNELALTKETELTIPLGVMGNTTFIDDVVPLGINAYVLVEHLDKTAGANTLSAHIINPMGNIAETETELMSMPFEKVMNSGFNYASVSPDKNTLAVVGEMPFDKLLPATFKISLYNTALKKMNSTEITLPGENKRNKSISVVVNNSGVVYLIKKSFTANGETALSVYQYDALKGGDVKEYAIELAEPNYITTYVYNINPNGQLMLGGTYYQRQTLSAGETSAKGIFFFTNNNMSEKQLTAFDLEKPVSLLTTRKILLNDNTIFLCAEVYKETREDLPAGSTGFDYNYNYVHQGEYVIGLNTDGSKKFETNIPRDFTARNFDRQFYSGYYICNGKLTLVCNDNTAKYIKDDIYHGYQIPIVMQIANDGSKQTPVVLKDNLKLEQGYMMYPGLSLQTNSKQLLMLIGNGLFFKPLSLSIE